VGVSRGRVAGGNRGRARGLHERPVWGPRATAEHRDRVASSVEHGIEEGAELVVDGREVGVPGYEGGYFLGPCIFDHVSPDMATYRDEIFVRLSLLLDRDLPGALHLLDTQRQELHHAGAPIKLRRKVYQVLVYLLAHRDRRKPEVQVWYPANVCPECRAYRTGSGETRTICCA
jgi:hypothetical protein